MDGSDDLNTTQWAAFVAFLVVLLVPLAVALAAAFKRRYAKAVVALQASTAARVAAPAPAHAAAADAPARVPVAGSLEVRFRAAGADVDPGGPDPTAPARRLRRRVLIGQFLAGTLYWMLLLLWLAIALLWMDQLMAGDAAAAGAAAPADAAGDAVDAWSSHLFVWPLLFVPPALGVALQAGWNERRMWLVGGVAALALAIGWAGVGGGWLGGVAIAAVATLVAALMAAFLRPSVRGAGPPLLTALTAGLLVLSVLLAVAAAFDTSDDDAPATAQDWLVALGILAMLLLPSAWAARRMLMRVARQYGAKRYSEQQLAHRAYWAVMTVLVIGAVLMISFEEATGGRMEWVALAVGLSWLAWRLMLRLALAWARRHAGGGIGPLLLLRVFKPSDRSEAFSDRFLARWRFAAPAWMIAGPDLAGAYMEPDEFFAYLQKRLHERFIASVDDVPARLQALDGARDPDGRFRVSELFCSNLSWKAAVLALIDRAGVIVLDLREYTSARAGTRFELEQLLRRAPLERVIVVADSGDDTTRLRDEITAAWQAAGGRDGTDQGAARLQVLQIGVGDDAEMDGLFRAAAAAAQVRRADAMADSS